MHRSGTSLITQWLSKCGLQTGERLVEPGHGNLDGHFEDVEFLKIHEEILANHNLPTSGLTDAHVEKFSIYEKEKVKCIIKVKQQLYDQWGWKDPRTCLFLNVYKELLPDACYLIIMRDYRSVIGSLLRREFKPVDEKYMSRKLISRIVFQKIRRPRIQKAFYEAKTEDYLKVWINYNQDILNCIKSLSNNAFVVVNYSMLNKEDTTVFSHLKNKWDFCLNYCSFGEVFKENLIGQDIDIYPFITDKTLVKRAEQLQHELAGYMMVS